MPSLSETRIYVKEDDDSHKRPLSEGDLPSKMPWYLKKGGQVDFNFFVKCKSPIVNINILLTSLFTFLVVIW